MLRRDLVLVVALAQGLLGPAVAATFVMGLGTAITVAAIATLAVAASVAGEEFAGSRSGYGMLALRGIEVGAAVLVLAFGSLLLVGYMARRARRLLCGRRLMPADRSPPAAASPAAVRPA